MSQKTQRMSKCTKPKKREHVFELPKITQKIKEIIFWKLVQFSALDALSSSLLLGSTHTHAPPSQGPAVRGASRYSTELALWTWPNRSPRILRSQPPPPVSGAGAPGPLPRNGWEGCSMMAAMRLEIHTQWHGHRLVVPGTVSPARSETNLTRKTHAKYELRRCQEHRVMITLHEEKTYVVLYFVFVCQMWVTRVWWKFFKSCFVTTTL